MPKTERTKGIRLQKLLAESGICSRRAAESLIQSGRGTVNGTTVTTLGSRALPPAATGGAGRALRSRRDAIHLVLHKPAGVVTTTRDPEGRPTVIQMVPKHL